MGRLIVLNKAPVMRFGELVWLDMCDFLQLGDGWVLSADVVVTDGGDHSVKLTAASENFGWVVNSFPDNGHFLNLRKQCGQWVVLRGMELVDRFPRRVIVEMIRSERVKKSG